MAVEVLAGIGVVFSILAVFFSYKLSREVRGEHYWVFYAIAAIAFGLAQASDALVLLSDFEIQGIQTLHYLGMTIGLFSLAYASYGLQSSMERVRKRLSG